jgi:peptidoglycan/xylan/chitin deacetylase (PgdA/CDA1 family)
MIFHRTPFLLPLLYPRLTWRMPDHKKELYLTFDDGPVPGITEFVLDTLAAHNAKATFFCIGDNVRKYPAIFKRILAEGHRPANHTFNHINGWRSTTQAYVDNVKLCETEIAKHTSDSFVPLFRPPYGRIRPSQIKALHEYKIIMWDVLSADYDRHLAEKKCLKNTINATRNGSLIVFHDSYKAEKNVTYALPRVLEHFSEKGFIFNAITG